MYVVLFCGFVGCGVGVGGVGGVGGVCKVFLGGGGDGWV